MMQICLFSWHITCLIIGALDLLRTFLFFYLFTANDYSFDRLFARQIETFGQAGDIAIGISTSGNSPNVLAGRKAAKELGMVTIGWTGGTGGQMATLVDYPFIVPTKNTPRIQEVHITLGHVLCERIDELMFGKG